MNPYDHSADRRFVWYTLVDPDLDPDVITAATGIAPSKQWRRGDERHVGRARYAFGRWTVDSGLPVDAEVPDHLMALIALLRPGWTELVRLGQVYTATIGLAIYLADNQGPWVNVGRDMVKVAAELNADIDVDIYTLFDPSERVRDSKSTSDLPVNGPAIGVEQKSELIGSMRRFREDHPLGGISIRDLIDDGRA